MRAEKKVMAFVDGTNLLIQLSEKIQIKFRADKPPVSCITLASALVRRVEHPSSDFVVRRYWFGSYEGTEQYHEELCAKLRKREFEPILFKRRKGREKGVDIALTREVLVNAFNENFDVGWLVAGDEDYVGLVKEAKRYGAQIKGAFFSSQGLSPELRLAFDQFADFDWYQNTIDEHLPKIKAEVSPS